MTKKTKRQLVAGALLIVMPLVVIASILAATYSALKPYFGEVKIAIAIEWADALDKIRTLANQVKNG
jgi:hypothetical protein